MKPLQKFIINFNSLIDARVTDDKTIKLPYMIKISQSLADDPEIKEFLNLDSNQRGSYMGIVINVQPDMTVVETYEEAFPKEK